MTDKADSPESSHPESGLPSDEQLEKLKNSIPGLAAIVDTGLTQYQVEWQRISNMQQSAGILIAGLTIVVSALLSFMSLDSNSSLIVERSYLNDIVYPTIYNAFVFVSISMLFFFRVIWPRQVKGLPNPKELASQFSHPELWKNLTTLIARIEGSVTDIHRHVETKQRFYFRSLYLFVASVVFTGVIILLLLLKISALQTIKLYYWGSLIVVSIVYMVITLTAKGD